MNPVAPVFPVMLPSRKQQEHDALTALSAGNSLFVVGEAGSGRTAFASRVLGARSRHGNNVVRLTGVSALRELPFAALASLATQLSGAPPRTDSPAHLLAAVTHAASSQRPSVLVDHAEELDESSTAALAQLAGSGVLDLVCVSRSVATLSAPLRRLAVSAEAHRVELVTLNLEDAIVLLEEILGDRVNSSTATVLLNLSGGNPLFLRELAFAAQAEGALLMNRGYWTVRAEWRPARDRISELISARLADQPEELHRVVSLLALTGELPMDFATRLVPAGDLDRAYDAGLIAIYDGGPAHTVQSAQVGLDSALTSHMVLTTLSRETLRTHAHHIRQSLPRQDMSTQLRISLAVHSQALDELIDPDDLLEDVAAAAQSRQFSAVLILTRMVGQRVFASWSTPESRARLTILRAQALHETGLVEEALTTLAPLLNGGWPTAEILAAWIEVTGRGDLPAALERMRSKTAEQAAYRRFLSLMGNAPVDLTQVIFDAENTDLPADLRLWLNSTALVEQSYRGTPITVVEDLEQIIDGDLWRQATWSACGSIAYPIFTAAMASGAVVEIYTRLAPRLDWDSLVFDHASFLLSQAAMALDLGQATTALDLVGQALALLTPFDPYSMAGALGAYGAAAATMLGEKERAAEMLALFKSSSAISGLLLRAEAERVSLAPELFLNGTRAARALYKKLLSDAESRGRHALSLRLRHDAWRLGLEDELQELKDAAQRVEGPLAESLKLYATAVDPLHDISAVEEIIMAHTAGGQLLYGAELANRAYDAAAAAGDRARASRLLRLSADLARTLDGVSTPALNRTRVDKTVLTEREYEVCIRAARGDSNVSIADELFLSPRTVEGHLQRAYAKLGVSDRRQLITPN